MSKHLRKFETEAEYSAATIYRPSVSLISDEMTVIFDPKPHDYSEDYLTFRALEDGTFSFGGSGAISANTLEYSVDSGSTWSTLQNSGTTPTVTSGNTILWKASGLAIGGNGVGIGKFSSTGLFEAEGNIMSLHFGDNFSGQTSLSGYDDAFMSLFGNCNTITSAENLILPATTLAYNCYANMFANCTKLTTAPQLPATTLASRCYQYMFQSCRSLTTAPQLPATTLASSCYSQMFNKCKSLNSITCLATDKSASYCTLNWVSSVAASGTFTKAASMTSWTEGTSGIPSGWTVVDYSG
jgi:hypothetical protein